jgi:tRNA modification GTPase
MLSKLSGWDDTIVALATAPGIGALAVIRLSGPDSIKIVKGLFPSKDLSNQATHTLHVGMLQNGEEVLDEVVVSIYRAPKSYTGEDVVEISCHGSKKKFSQPVYIMAQEWRNRVSLRKGLF